RPWGSILVPSLPSLTTTSSDQRHVLIRHVSRRLPHLDPRAGTGRLSAQRPDDVDRRWRDRSDRDRCADGDHPREDEGPTGTAIGLTGRGAPQHRRPSPPAQPLARSIRARRTLFERPHPTSLVRATGIAQNARHWGRNRQTSVIAAVSPITNLCRGSFWQTRC